MRRMIVLWALLVPCPLAGMYMAPSAAAQEAPAEATPERIAELIQQLGDDDFFVRERAQTELQGIGFEAFDALTAAETDDDIEISARAKYLLRKIRVEWVAESDSPQVKEILKDYERANTTDRLQRMQRLAQLPDDAGLPALCRLLRFEQSPINAKQAALRVMELPNTETTDWARREKIITETLARTQRSPAEWLKVYLAAHHDLAAAYADWAALCSAEEQTLSQYPDQTQAEVVLALLRQQIEWLDQLNRGDESLDVLKRMLALAAGDADALRAVAVQFYKLAEKREQSGDEDAAQNIADQARAISPGNTIEHLRVAIQLRGMGLLKWAEQEYRHVISLGPPGREFTLLAQWSLAEMLHDQDKELAAAEVLQPAAAAMQENVRQGNAQNNRGREPGESRARMHYFFANHFAAQGDRDKQIEHLEAGLKDNPLDADVLIAMYRLPEQTPEWKERTKKAIEKAAAAFRQEIENDPDNPENAIPYNQLAWLIGNTEGDYDEAVRSALKALELRPETPEYMDTLGRCYFTKGDLENAIKHQSKAVELDPHSGQMQRQLELFLAAQAEKQK
ncbi:MAG: tetratricopeptide repeat protein [Pirellulales bacterium]